LNARIEVTLELFEKLNLILAQKNPEITKFYDSVKDNMVKVLNEIVENYAFRDPKKISYECT
jgi:hypothetical protein